VEIGGIRLRAVRPLGEEEFEALKEWVEKKEVDDDRLPLLLMALRKLPRVLFSLSDDEETLKKALAEARKIDEEVAFYISQKLSGQLTPS
jgi:hypothetical protein